MSLLLEERKVFVCLRSYGVMTPMFRGCVADYYVSVPTTIGVWNLAKRRILISHLLSTDTPHRSSRNDECAENISYCQSLKEV